jgi:hypothetical protein
MPDSGWAGVATPALAAARCAESVLRVLGAATVQFRFPLQASATADGAQLGTQPPAMEEVNVSPVLVRRPQSPASFKSGFELVIAATTLDPLAGSRGASDVTGLMALVDTIGWNGRSFRVGKITSELFGGSEYLYRLQVTE